MNSKSRKEKLKKLNATADQNILIKKIADNSATQTISAEEYVDNVIDALLDNIKIKGLED